MDNQSLNEEVFSCECPEDGDCCYEDSCAACAALGGEDHCLRCACDTCREPADSSPCQRCGSDYHGDLRCEANG